MQNLLMIYQFIVSHWAEVLAAILAILMGLVGLLGGLIAIFMMVPGAEPEATLQKILDALQKAIDFVEKYSKK